MLSIYKEAQSQLKEQEKLKDKKNISITSSNSSIKNRLTGSYTKNSRNLKFSGNIKQSKTGNSNSFTCNDKRTANKIQLKSYNKVIFKKEKNYSTNYNNISKLSNLKSSQNFNQNEKKITIQKSNNAIISNKNNIKHNIASINNNTDSSIANNNIKRNEYNSNSKILNLLDKSNKLNSNIKEFNKKNDVNEQKNNNTNAPLENIIIHNGNENNITFSSISQKDITILIPKKTSSPDMHSCKSNGNDRKLAKAVINSNIKESAGSNDINNNISNDISIHNSNRNINNLNIAQRNSNLTSPNKPNISKNQNKVNFFLINSSNVTNNNNINNKNFPYSPYSTIKNNNNIYLSNGNLKVLNTDSNRIISNSSTDNLNKIHLIKAQSNNKENILITDNNKISISQNQDKYISLHKASFDSDFIKDNNNKNEIISNLNNEDLKTKDVRNNKTLLRKKIQSSKSSSQVNILNSINNLDSLVKNKERKLKENKTKLIDTKDNKNSNFDNKILKAIPNKEIITVENQKENNIDNNKGKQQNFILLDLTFIKILGKGAFSNVYLYENKNKTNNLPSFVSVKIYEKKLLSDNIKNIGVENEISILQKLNHPLIIKLFTYEETKTQYRLFFEYFEGFTLYEYVKKVRLSEKAKFKIIMDITKALHFCHKNYIAHRDLKLENIMILKSSNDISIKLIDFGFAVNVESQKINSFCGTPSYMAPEIILKKEYNPYKADIWALGIIIYSLLCDEMPFSVNKLKKLSNNNRDNLLIYNNNKNNQNTGYSYSKKQRETSSSKIKLFSKNKDTKTISNNERELYECILENDVNFNTTKLSLDAIDLLRNMLNSNPSLRPSLEDVRL